MSGLFREESGTNCCRQRVGETADACTFTNMTHNPLRGSEERNDAMDIEYRINCTITGEQFIDILRRSSLAERRPVNDRACIESMLKNANLLVSAWRKSQLVGVARSVTDFTYCCYLSDLAVDKEFQKSGIGRRLIAATQGALGSQCTIILLAAPAAVDYYPHLGFEHHPQAWVLPAHKRADRAR